MRIRCKACGDVLKSPMEGQLVRCGCGALAVDALPQGEGKTRILGPRDGWELVRDPEMPEEVVRRIDQQFDLMQTSEHKEGLTRVLFGEESSQVNCSEIPNSCSPTDDDTGIREMIQEAERPMIPAPRLERTLQLPPEDQAALAESVQNPPPLADALLRAREKRKQLFEQAAESSSGKLPPVLSSLAEAGKQPVTDCDRLKFPLAVRVLQDIPAEVIFGGGWGGGPDLLKSGAKIWLQGCQGEVVSYLDGSMAPVVGETRGGGSFNARWLSQVEEITGFPRAVRVKELVPVYLGGAGWANGWDVLQPGTELLLTGRNEELIDFVLGTRPLKYGEPREDGWIHVDRLGSLEDL